jgi:predicted CXXCH cytochrome family protein
MPSPAVDQNDLECSACHREHQGADADLLAVSDAQCQTCHADRFGSFADSHPGWGTWPYGRGGEISFDHQSHMTKHYPSSASSGVSAKFDCGKCHQRDQHGEIARTVTFESGCQSCHGDAIRIESAKGFELLALPTVPRHLNAASMWPEAATGPLDGKISPLASLLMRSDPAAADCLRVIGTADLSTLNPDDPNIAGAIQELTAAHERLLQGLADRGQVEIVQRLEHSGISAATLTEIVRNLPAQLLIEAHANWFQPAPNRQAAAGQNSAAAGQNSAAAGQNSAAETIQQVSFNEASDAPSQNPLPLPLATGTLQAPANSQRQETKTGSILLPAQPGNELYFAAPKASQTKPTGNPTAQESPAKIAQLPLAQSPTNQQKNDNRIVGPSEDLISDDPMSLDYAAGNDLAGDPLAEDPLADDPLAIDPLAADPLAIDPLAADPLASDPLASDPLASDPLGADPLSQSPASPPPSRPVRFDVATMMPSGGWYRDPIRMSIAYRGNGHSDPVLQAAVELIGRLPPGDPVRKQMLASRSMSTCVSCHTTATDFRPNWHAQPLVGAKAEFTKFTHGPHLKIAQLADCVHCHEVNSQKAVTQDESDNVRLASFNSDRSRQEPLPDPHEFLPLKKHSCATCHNSKAAGESCAKCHRYHIQQ